MRIDGHAHAAGEFLKGEKIVEILDALKVDAVALCPGEWRSAKTHEQSDLAGKHPDRDYIYLVNKAARISAWWSSKAKGIGRGNQYVHELSLGKPGRILQFYWLDTRRPGALAEMQQHYDSWRFAGVKMNQCWTRFSPDDELVNEIAEWCGQVGLPLFLHLYAKKDIFLLLPLCRRHTATSFIIGHLIGSDFLIDQQIRLENIWLDISPPQLVPEKKIVAAVRFFGAERIIMGSDVPYGRDNLKRILERVEWLPIHEREKDLIMGENLRQLLRLPTS